MIFVEIRMMSYNNENQQSTTCVDRWYQPIKVQVMSAIYNDILKKY